MNTLIYRQGNYGSICFPYKKSCGFATTKCLKECSEQHNDMTWFSETFDTFKNSSAVALYATIRDELKESGFRLLTWFDCGDCPARLTKKIVEIIRQLAKEKFWQLGFTRNLALWQSLAGVKRVRFILTVERGSRIKDEGYYAVPNYKKQRVAILHYHTFDRPISRSIDKIIARGEANVRYCGGGGSYMSMKTVTEPEKNAQCSISGPNAALVTGKWGRNHEANCEYCLEGNRGCFYDRRIT